MNTAKKIRSMMLAMAALLTFGFAFTSCSNDEDFPPATNTVTINGVTSDITEVTIVQDQIYKGGEPIDIEQFNCRISPVDVIAVSIPKELLGKTIDLTEKLSVSSEAPTGVIVYKDLGGDWEEKYFICPDEEGNIPEGLVKEGTMIVTASDGKVNIYAKGIGLQYDKNHPEADPVEMPFEVSYSGPYIVIER